MLYYNQPKYKKIKVKNNQTRIFKIMQDETILNQTKHKQKQIPKSSLNPFSGNKNTNIQYLKETDHNDQPIQISDQQKQQQINKLRQQYILQKLNRKKQQIKRKRQQYGSSSSQDDDVGVQQSLSGHSEEFNDKIQQKIRQSGNIQKRVQDQGSLLNKQQKVFILKGKQNWNQTTALVKQHSLVVGETNFDIVKIAKIKSIPTLVSKNLFKIKISYNNEDLMIAASKQSLIIQKQRLSLHYVIFASVIMRKLQMMGLKFYQLQKNVPGVPQSIIKNCSIYGKIFKKSQIFGRWQQRLIVINQMGMYSYKRFNQQHSMFIAANTVKQIWTRFQIVDQNLLVIKILHSSNTKTQFGIPITNFISQKNWLYQFYHMGLVHAK